MDSLPPNATAEDIENEILIYHVLMDSLDQFDEDYESKKFDIEQPRMELEARLQQLRGGASSTPTVIARTPTSSRYAMDLPAREQGEYRNTRLSLESPLAARASNAPLASAARTPHLSIAGPSLGSSSASSTHDGNAKRQRESWGFDRLDDMNANKKSKLNDGAGSASTVSTPATIDSLDEEEAALEERHGISFGSTKDAIMKKIMEQQRQQEMRLKREQEDAEFARLLEAQQRVPTPAPSASQQPRYQATVNPHGQIRRPIPPPALPPPPSAVSSRPLLSQPVNGYRPVIKPENNNSTAGATAFMEEQRTKVLLTHEHTHREQLIALAAAQQRRALQALREDVKRPPLLQPQSYDDGSDDDFAEITPYQFAATTSPRSQASGLPPYHTGVRTNAAQNSFVANGYVPPAARTPMVGGMSVYNPQPTTASSGNGYGLSGALERARSAATATGEFWNTMNSALGILRPYGAGPSVNPLERSVAGYPAFAGSQGLGVGGLAFPHSYGEEGDSDSEGSIEILRARNFDPFGSLTPYDHAKSKEELEKLLDSIRPDEDIPPEKRDQPKELKCRLHEHQKLGLAWLKTQEEGNNKGGILADDMGLGKTIQAIALIVSRPSDDPARRTTLILAPVALMRQWAEEIKDQLHARYKLSVFIYHGSQKKVSFATLSTYDVVISTYGKLASEYKIKANLEVRRAANRDATLRPNERLSLIGENCRWYRVILDEAQCIKNKSTKTSMGACHLTATYRLCMSGTPMMNSIFELYPLIRFLRIKPYDEHERFLKDFRVLKGSSPHGRERAMQAFQALLKAMLLRRTKKSQVDGKPILQLPERVTEVVHAVFDEDERALYTALETETRLEVNRYLEAGKIGRNYTYVLVRLLRLRQACCHPQLIKDFAEDGPGDIPVEDMRKLAASLDQSVVARLKATEGNFECPICYDAAENPTIFFPCGHDVCTECFARMTDPANGVASGDADGSVQAKCPECRAKVDSKKILNWTSFKQAHMPSEEDEQNAAVKGEVDDDDDTESESDVDDDDASDGDSQGDLRDFIVDDDEVAYDEDATDDGEEVKGEASSRVKPEPTDDGDLDLDDDDAPYRPARKAMSKPIAKAKTNTKGKGKPNSRATRKGKGRGKPKEKKKKTLADLKKESLKNVKAKKRYLRRLQKTYQPSAKITKTLEILRAIREKGEGEKTLIFSQFTSLLDLLEVAFEDEWKYRRYDGSMSAKARDDAVQDFKGKREVEVMLVSLKAGNAGLNLTAASQVVILDPFWNPFIEEQAIDRAHRLGQLREVVVHRVLVAETVEDRIIALQEKKREIITQALDEKAGQSVSRLGRAELAYLFGITPTVQAS